MLDLSPRSFLSSSGMGERSSYLNIRENRILMFLFLALFALVIMGLFFIFRYYIWIFLFAVMLYLPLKPLNQKLLRRVKKSGISAGIIILLLFLIFIVPSFYLLAALIDQTYQFYHFIQQEINSGVLRDIQNSETFRNVLRLLDINEAELLHRGLAMIRQYVFKTFSGVTFIISFPLTFMAKFLLMILMLFFLLKDGTSISSIIYRVLPFPMDLEREIVERLKRVIKLLLAGNLFIMILQGLMLGIGLYIAGFSAPLLWGSIGSVLSLIPVIGTTMIWIPAVIYLLVAQSYMMALFLGFWCIFWYFVLENLLKPIIFGETLNFHPVVLFFLLLGSIQAFGLAGVIIGPVLLTLFYSLWEIYRLLDVYNPRFWPWKKAPEPEQDESGNLP
jgi:predicted PurR-regulated permease PerM